MKQHSNHKIIFVVIGLLGTTVPAFSQNMNNPYSVYGIGDIDHRVYDRTAGMAGTGLAMKSDFYLIDNNPASIIGLPKSFFTGHLALTGRASKFSGEPISSANSNNKDAWVKKLTIAAKINNFWASSFGFSQFSNINYKFSGTKFIEGTTTEYNTSFEGDGGLNEYYFTNAFAVGKRLSLGIRTSIIAGNITQGETLVDDGLQTAITTTQQDYIGNFRLQTGLIYDIPLNKKWDLSIGARFSPKTTFKAERTLTVTENGEKIAEETYIKNDRFYLPSTIGTGIALRKNRFSFRPTTFTLDYTFENWKSLGINERSWQLINSHKVSAGVQFSKFKMIRDFNAPMEYKYFQFGGFFHNSYLQVRNQPIREYGITAGIGGMFGQIDKLGNSARYSLTGELGVRGTTKSGLIRETYVGVTLTVSYFSFLFSKGRKYD